MYNLTTSESTIIHLNVYTKKEWHNLAIILFL